MRLAIYAGSFNPFTKGHLEIVQGAMKAFDRVLIAVGINRQKSGFMQPQERMVLIQEVLDDTYQSFFPEARPTVCTFEGLLVDLCRAQFNLPLMPGKSETIPDTVTIVRGLRAVSDFEAEMAIADANRRLDVRFQTVFIPTRAEMAFVSSSTVRELLSHNVNDARLEPYLTRAAIRRLREERWPTGA